MCSYHKSFGIESLHKAVNLLLLSKAPRKKRLPERYRKQSRLNRIFPFLLTEPLNDVECITETCLYNFDPLKPHFYIVKLGFTGVYIIFLISAQKHKLWLLVRTASVLTSNHNPCFEQKYEKYQSFSSENFQFLEVKFSICLNRRVFVMVLAQSGQDLRYQRTEL